MNFPEARACSAIGAAGFPIPEGRTGIRGAHATGCVLFESTPFWAVLKGRQNETTVLGGPMSKKKTSLTGTHVLEAVWAHPKSFVQATSSKYSQCLNGSPNMHHFGGSDFRQKDEPPRKDEAHPIRGQASRPNFLRRPNQRGYVRVLQHPSCCSGTDERAMNRLLHEERVPLCFNQETPLEANEPAIGAVGWDCDAVAWEGNEPRNWSP